MAQSKFHYIESRLAVARAHPTVPCHRFNFYKMSIGANGKHRTSQFNLDVYFIPSERSFSSFGRLRAATAIAVHCTQTHNGGIYFCYYRTFAWSYTVHSFSH